MAPFGSHSPVHGRWAYFPIWGNGCWASALLHSLVLENVCCTCPLALLVRSLSAPSSVISSQLAGPDAPDTVNKMLKFMAG